jgi:hypothetical protein
LQANSIEDVLIHCGSVDVKNLVQPTNSGAYGVRLPAVNNSPFVRVDGLTVFGYGVGLQDGELADIRAANFWGCATAIECAQTYYPSRYGMVGIYWCTVGVSAAGAHGITADLIDVEHAHGHGQPWNDTIADLSDPNNLLVGDLKWWSVANEIGNDHTFTKNGGTGVIATELGGGSAPPPPPPQGGYMLSILPADFNLLSGPQGSYQDIGLSVSLPAAGTYRIDCDLRSTLQVSSGSAFWISACLNDGVQVAGTERLITLASQAGIILENTAPLTAFLTVTAPTTVKVLAKYDANAATSWSVAKVASDPNGRSMISAVQIA